MNYFAPFLVKWIKKFSTSPNFILILAHKTSLLPQKGLYLWNMSRPIHWPDLVRCLHTRHCAGQFSPNLRVVLSSVFTIELQTKVRRRFHKHYYLEGVFWMKAAITAYDKCDSASRHFQPGEGPSKGLLRDCEILAKVRLKLYWTQTWTAPAPVAADLAAAATLPELQQHCCCRQLFTNTTTTTIFLAVLSFQHQQQPHFTLGTCDYFPAAIATTQAVNKAAVSAGNIQCAARRQKYFTSKKWFARDAIWMMTVYYCAANCTHNCCRTLCRMQHGPISPRDIAFLLCKLRNCGAGQSAGPGDDDVGKFASCRIFAAASCLRSINLQCEHRQHSSSSPAAAGGGNENKP